MASKTTFISYSSQDETLIEGVTKMLRTQGRIFRDKDSIQPGENWKESIDKAIEKARQVIVFWCCHSAESEWVKYELLKAMELKKPIIPVLCCGCKVDAAIRQFQWIDIRKIIRHDCSRPNRIALVALAAVIVARIIHNKALKTSQALVSVIDEATRKVENDFCAYYPAELRNS